MEVGIPVVKLKTFLICANSNNFDLQIKRFEQWNRSGKCTERRVSGYLGLIRSSIHYKFTFFLTHYSFSCSGFFHCCPLSGISLFQELDYVLFILRGCLVSLDFYLMNFFTMLLSFTQFVYN